MIVKLALGNVKRSVCDFAVYFITVALGVAVFYAFNTIADQADFLSGEVSGIVASIGGIMAGLTVFLALVLGFLMVYANNFLVRRRKRELGLYQVLGMRRSQVSAVLAAETLISGVGALACGLVLGILLSQLLVFVTAALFHDSVSAFSFKVSPDAALFTLGCFALMFAVMELFNLRALRRVRLVELMEAEHVNEEVKLRSLPASVAVFAAAAALIGVSYARLLHDGLPISGFEGQAGTDFAVTTGMVAAGTVALFYALSGFLTGAIRHMPRLYWRGLNMLTVRQLASRVNTASGSMAAIALVLFLAITSVTTGVSVCSVLASSIEQRNPYDASVSVYHIDPESPLTYQQVPVDAQGTPAAGYGAASGTQDIVGLLAGAGYDLTSVADVVSLDLREASSLADGTPQSIDEMTRATGVEPSSSLAATSDAGGMEVVGVTNFNELRELLGLDPIELADDEYAIGADLGEGLSGFYDAVMAAGYKVTLAGRELSPAGPTIVDASASFSDSVIGSNPGSFIVPDDIAAQASPSATFIDMRYKPGRAPDAAEMLDALESLSTKDVFVQDGVTFAYLGSVVQREQAWQSMNGMSGIVSYMAVYIGFVLVVACAAILAIQQLCAASDAQRGWRLLWELGAPRRLVHRSVFAQTLVYFLLPLLAALAHSLVALSVVRDVVELFGAFDITSAALCCGLLFVAVYGAYFFATYRLSRGMANATMA